MSNPSAPAGGSFLTGLSDAECLFAPEQLPAEARLMARSMDDFLQRDVNPIAERLEAQDDGLLAAAMSKAGAAGLLAGAVPEAYGGLGLPKSTLALLSEHAAVNSSFAISVGVHTGIALMPLLYFGAPEQKERYLPKLATGEMLGAFCLTEAGSGSDALAAATRASPLSGGKAYRLTGEKLWITNAAVADLFLVFAKIEGAGLTAFLVERGTAGLSLGREERKIGLHGSSTRRVVLDGCVVPEENILGEIGKGYRPALYCLNIGRFNIAVSALGNGKECLRLAAAHADQRAQFGQPIARFGAIRAKIGEMAARLYALESMLYRIAGWWDERLASLDYESESAASILRAATEEYAIECALVKVYGAEALAFVVDEALQIHGGSGYSEELPIARHWRDARVARIYEGTSEINRLTAVDQLARRAKSGRIDLGGAIATAATRRGAKRVDEMEYLRCCVLQTVGSCRCVLDDPFGDAQEIAIEIADMLAGLFAAQSAHLRAARHAAGDTDAEQAARLAARLRARDLRSGLRDGSERIAAALGTEPRMPDADVGFDSIAARRAISDLVLLHGGYPWG